jgi:hypothetical protein
MKQTGCTWRSFLVKYSAILLLVLILVLSACGNGTPATSVTTPSFDIGKIPGETFTDANIQQNVVSGLNLYESTSKSGCSNPRIAGVEIVQKPTEQNGPWIERWIIDRCGKTTVAYLITFTPDTKNGGASLSIALETKK